MDIWLETIGLPPRCREEMLDLVRREGVDLEANTVLIGVDRGLRLQQVTVYDGSLGRWPLLRADEIQIVPERAAFLARQFRLRRLEVDNATLSLPLTLASGGPVLKLEQVFTMATERADAYELRQFRGRFEQVRLSASGRLIKDPDAPAAGFDAARWLANRDRIAGLSAVLLDRLLVARQFCSLMQNRERTSVDLTFEVPLAAPAASRAEAVVRMHDFLWRGLAVERLAGRLAADPDEVRIDDLRLQLEGGENLQAQARLDRHQRKVSGTMSSRLYPERLLKLVSLELLDSPYWPVFEGAPPYFALTLEPSPLDRPLAWRVSGYGEIEKTRVFHGMVKTARGHVSWDDGRLSVRDFLAVLPGRTTATADYDYYPMQGSMLLRGQVNGNPMAIPAFADSPPFLHDMELIWKDFRWDDVPPTLNLELCRYLDGDRECFVVQGQAAMHGVTFQGQRLDGVTANVLVDLVADRLVVSNLRVNHDGKVTSGNLLYAFPAGRQWLEFDAESALDPRLMVALIHPKWPGLLDRWELSFPEGATASIRGRVMLDGEGPTGVKATVRGPAVVWTTATGRDFSCDLDYDGSRLQAGLQAASISVNALAAEGVTGRLETDFTRLRGSGTAVRLSQERLSANNVAFDYEAADGVLTGQAGCASGAVGGSQPLTLTNIRLDRVRVTERTVTAIASASQVAGELVQVEGLNGRLTATPDAVKLDGSGSSLVLPAWQARASSFTFSLEDEDAGTSMEVTVPRLDYGTQAGAEELTCRWVQRGNDLAGQGTAKRVTVPDLGEAEQVVVNFESRGGAIAFYQTSQSLDVPPLKLIGVSCSGTLGKGSVIADLTSQAGLVSGRYPIGQLAGTATYQNRKLSFNYVKAAIYGGQLNGNLQVDVERHLGQAHLAIAGMELAHLMEGRGGKPARGRMDTQAGITFTYKDGNLLLSGQGESHIREGEIWRLPLMGEFLDLIGSLNLFGKLGFLPSSGDSAGSITEMEAYFHFLGDRIHFDQIRTNGSLLAISADGDYWWKTQGMNFRVRAHLLKKVIPLPLFNPFMVFFERRRVGTLNDAKWEELTAFKDVFRNLDLVTDPTLKQAPEAGSALPPPATTEQDRK